MHTRHPVALRAHGRVSCVAAFLCTTVGCTGKNTIELVFTPLGVHDRWPQANLSVAAHNETTYTCLELFFFVFSPSPPLNMLRAR